MAYVWKKLKPKNKIIIHNDMPVKLLLDAINKGFIIMHCEDDCIILEMPQEKDSYRENYVDFGFHDKK